MDASLHHASFSMTNHSMPIFGLGDEPLNSRMFRSRFFEQSIAHATNSSVPVVF